jgi:hypothetical protein
MATQRVGQIGFSLVAVALTPSAAQAEDASSARPSVVWTALQLVPSPGVSFNDRGTHAALRWQVTPAAWSYAAPQGVDSLRSLVVPPILRYGGSIEAHWSPGLRFDRTTTFRHDAGLRAYVPLAHKGEYLSASVGSALAFEGGEARPAYEAGLYTLFGFLGVVANGVPAESQRSLTVTLHLRVY